MYDEETKKRWWMFMDEVWWENEGYTQDEMRALILDKIEQKNTKIKGAVTRISQKSVAESMGREIIPDHVKSFVWQRDSGRCVKCGSQQRLEFDHIIPIAKGGSNTARNLQLLCETCNRSKGANLI
jgi:hypothetical protein